MKGSFVAGLREETIKYVIKTKGKEESSHDHGSSTQQQESKEKLVEM
jgi:hypothetical protein